MRRARALGKTCVNNLMMLSKGSTKFRIGFWCRVLHVCKIYVFFAFVPWVLYHFMIMPKGSSNPRLYEHITLWSTDYHITPIADVKELMKNFNVTVIDKSLSGHCGLTQTCAKDLKVLSRDNAYNTGLRPGLLARRVFDAYKGDAEFGRVHAVICSHPLTPCELYLPLNRSLILISTTRYEHGHFPPDEWRLFNRLLQDIARDKRHVVGANSRYDVEYIKYFTGVSAEYVPSYCGHVAARYNASRNEVLLARSHVPGNPGTVWKFAYDAILSAVEKNHACASYSFAGIDDLYHGHYEYKQLARHPAVVHFPYQVSVMSFFEHYQMAIPIFVPSLDFLIELHMQHNMVSERTWEFVRTGKRPSGSPLPKHPDYPVDFDPNNDIDAAALRYWLSFADFFTFPHIQYFSSFDDLVCKLARTDLKQVSLAMSRHSNRLKKHILSKWQDILERVDAGYGHTGSSHVASPSTYNDVAARFESLV